MQIRFVLLLSRQGKVRLAKWYTTLSQKERAKIMKEVTPLVLGRAPKLCNFVDWRDAKIIYRRYASLYFVAGIDAGAQRTLMALQLPHLLADLSHQSQLVLLSPPIPALPPCR